MIRPRLRTNKYSQ